MAGSHTLDSSDNSAVKPSVSYDPNLQTLLSTDIFLHLKVCRNILRVLLTWFYPLASIITVSLAVVSDRFRPGVFGNGPRV